MLKIQTRRQARTEGYADIEDEAVPSITSDAASYDRASVNADIISHSPVEYTTRAAAPDVPARPQKPEVSLKNERIYVEKEDVKPSEKTRVYADAESTVGQTRRQSKGGLDPRTKVLLCVYIAVALVLAIAVIATGVAISNTAAKVDKLQISVAENRAVYAEREAMLLELGNAESIRVRALEEGMVDAGPATYVFEAAPDYDYPEAQPRTNGFDKFCDWLSKVVN